MLLMQTSSVHSLLRATAIITELILHSGSSDTSHLDYSHRTPLWVSALNERGYEWKV